MAVQKWYEAENIDEYDSPVLLFYPARIRENIRKLVAAIPARILRPHVKTNKTAEVCSLMMEAGITKFKAATIAEAEMLAGIKAPDVLFAFPPTIPKIIRLIQLIRKYPSTRFSCIADHPNAARFISGLFDASDLTANLFIDLNVGMNRTGILPEKAMPLFQLMLTLPAIHVAGLHAYDGHIKDKNPAVRREKCDNAFAPVMRLKIEIEKIIGSEILLIAGGSPTCYIHAEAGERECSPGTFVFWDKGYEEQLPEQTFEWAALLACRIVSVPAGDLICVDLGYKSVASENPLPRIFFLNLPGAVSVAQSEEHLVLRVPDAHAFTPGEVLYGVPWHICPTVALFDQACLVEDNKIIGSWTIMARTRIL